MGSALTTCIATACGAADFGYPLDAELRELFILEGGLQCIALELRDDCCMRDTFVAFLHSVSLPMWRQQPVHVLSAVLRFAVAPCLQEELYYDLTNSALCALVRANHKRLIGELLGTMLRLDPSALVNCLEAISDMPFLGHLLSYVRKSLRTGEVLSAKLLSAKLLKEWQKMPFEKRARASIPPSISGTSDATSGLAGPSNAKDLHRHAKVDDATQLETVERPVGFVGDCCAVCHAVAPLGQPFSTCGDCGSYAYCGKKHAKHHWKHGHKEECALLLQERTAEKHRVCFMGAC